MIDAAIWRMITGNKWDRGQSVKVDRADLSLVIISVHTGLLVDR